MPSPVLIGTYPPTQCGIATFTSRLRAAIDAPGSGWHSDVIRVVVADDRPTTASEVIASFCPGDHASLVAAVRATDHHDAAVIQHEYGIYGEDDGAAVVDLARRLRPPVVTVLHTVVPTPSPGQRRVLEDLADHSRAIVVLSESARRRLLAVHPIDPERVQLIPHGAAANFDGPIVKTLPRPLVLTWGLLGAGKGIEHVIEAIAALARAGLRVHYLVVGRTHPKTEAREGDRYREELRALARGVGVDDLVHFDGGYHDLAELDAIVRTADVVVLPYDSTDQVTSGVLVEALASGKPVIATAFPHAREMLAAGAGIVVAHRDPDALASALVEVLHRPGVSTRMRAAAREAAAPLLWPKVGASFRAVLGRVMPRVTAA